MAVGHNFLVDLLIRLYLLGSNYFTINLGEYTFFCGLSLSIWLFVALYALNNLSNILTMQCVLVGYSNGI